MAVESFDRHIAMAFLDRIKEEFTKRYGGGKAATAIDKSLNKEFGYYLQLIVILCIKIKVELP